jgi:hypothetical protein
MEKLENENKEPIEGEHNSPIQKEKLFSNLTALADYIKVFSIQAGAFGRANVDGKDCYILQYRSREE